MPNTRRFDGPDLQAVLDRVRTEIGPDARILGAEKVRHGGVAGFFAREFVEVEVEVPEGAAPPAPPAPVSQPVPVVRIDPPERSVAEPGLMRLVSLVDEEERRAAPPVAPATTPTPTLSTETPDFATFLDRMTAEAEPDVAPPPRAAAPRTFPMKEATPFEPPRISRDMVPPLVDTVPSLRPTIAAARPVVATDDSRDVIDIPSTTLEEEEPVPAPGRRARLAERPARARRAPRRATSAVERRVPLSAALERLGLPESFVPGDEAGSLRDALTARLAGVPKAKAIPTHKGAVVAVVGERDAALELAHLFAEQTGRSGDRVVLASRHVRPSRSLGYGVVRTLDAAAEERLTWRWRNGPTFVAIDAPLGHLDDMAWGADLLAAAEPHQAWGVVAAYRKVEDVGVWSVALGHLDTLALHGMGETTTPAAILGLGVPVGLIDGRIADAAAWADLLVARMELAS